VGGRKPLETVIIWAKVNETVFSFFEHSWGPKFGNHNFAPAVSSPKTSTLKFNQVQTCFEHQQSHVLLNKPPQSRERTFNLFFVTVA
jgi:hypothetical protein